MKIMRALKVAPPGEHSVSYNIIIIIKDRSQRFYELLGS